MLKTIFFSQLEGKKVKDSKGNDVGLFSDLVFLDGKKFAKITGLVVKSNGFLKKIDWRYVESVEKNFYLNAEKEKISFEEVSEKDFLANEMLMDRQVIDVNGVKLLKVNDVLLSKMPESFAITGVDVGTAGIIRRLGISRYPKLFQGKFISEKIIPWERVAPLELSAVSDIKLDFEREKLSEIHPADLADLLEDLSHTERTMVFNTINPKQAAETLAEVNPEVSKSLFKNLKKIWLAAIIAKMPPDEAADLLSVAPPETVKELLKSLNPDVSKKLLGLLAFPKETAGGMMNPNVLSIPMNLTVNEAIALLRDKMKNIERAYYIYVVDGENHLTGMTSLRRLIISAPEQKIVDFMSEKTYRVQTTDSFNRVVKTIEKYNLLALPVVDSENKLVGVIAMDDVFQKLVPKKLREKRYRHVHFKSKLEKIEPQNSIESNSVQNNSIANNSSGK